jgi:hypothetical protein
MLPLNVTCLCEWVKDLWGGWIVMVVKPESPEMTIICVMYTLFSYKYPSDRHMVCFFKFNIPEVAGGLD